MNASSISSPLNSDGTRDTSFADNGALTNVGNGSFELDRFIRQSLHDGVSGNWTLVTTGIPAGDLYFRAIASAAGFQDRLSTVIGPITVPPRSPNPFQPPVLWRRAAATSSRTTAVRS